MPTKVTPDTDFMDERVVQMDVPVVNVTLLMLMLANDKNKWLQINFDMNTDYTLLEFILCMVIVSKEIETYNLVTAFIRSRMVSLT